MQMSWLATMQDAFHAMGEFMVGLFVINFLLIEVLPLILTALSE